MTRFVGSLLVSPSRGSGLIGRGRSTKTISLVESIRQVLKDIQRASVRAVCYQLFSLRLIASMSKAETNRVSRILARAREDGIIPWSWVVDEPRKVEVAPSWKNPEEFAEAATSQYRRNRWQDPRPPPSRRSH